MRWGIRGSNAKANKIIKPAIESVKELKNSNQKFDLIFIDADKENYLNYYNASIELINKNGLIIIDKQGIMDVPLIGGNKKALKRLKRN